MRIVDLENRKFVLDLKTQSTIYKTTYDQNVYQIGLRAFICVL